MLLLEISQKVSCLVPHLLKHFAIDLHVAQLIVSNNPTYLLDVPVRQLHVGCVVLSKLVLTDVHLDVFVELYIDEVVNHRVLKCVKAFLELPDNRSKVLSLLHQFLLICPEGIFGIHLVKCRSELGPLLINCKVL